MIEAVATVRPVPETVASLLDTTWRVAASEDSRTDALDGKAAGLSSFAAVALSLTATLGSRLVRHGGSSPLDLAILGLYLAALAGLVLTIALSVGALWPKERLTLGMEYLEGFPAWREIVKQPGTVQGDTMRALIDAVAHERARNRKKTRHVRWAFAVLLAALAFVATDASILAFESLA